MRGEDIVGVSFFAVLIAGVVVAVAGSRNSLTPRHRRLWWGWGLGLAGCALVGFGLVSYQMIHNSPRPVVEGNLWEIRQGFRGSTRFMITDAAGRAVPIRCRYTGPGLVEGERARVRYVAYNRKLLEMDMLDGSYQSWNLRETSGEAGCWSWVAIGAICGFFAFRQLSSSGANADAERGQ